MAQLNGSNLIDGTCYAIAHCAHLIEDAAVLYLARRISSSFHLAVMAREEHGRANILWTEALRLGSRKTTDRKLISKMLQDHVKKLHAGQTTTYVTMPPTWSAERTSALARGDKAALEALDKELKERVCRQRKRDPGLLHQRRLKAQYVNLEPSGHWSRPSEITTEEARNIIHTVALEIQGTLLGAVEDAEISSVCARLGVGLPTYSEFQLRVVNPLLSESRPPDTP